MPKNEEGEFELILGNRQLISVFLIVVVLLGVFFSMGYIVGRNSPAPVLEARNDKSGPDTGPDSADGATPSAQPVQSANNSTTPPPSDAPPSTQPEAAKPEPVKTKPSPVQSSAPPPHASEHASVAGDPPGGEYWQVVATSRPDAEIVAEALGKRGFHTLVTPAPKDGIYRVLVGPLADASTQASTRTGLESAGFKNPIMRKY